MWIYPTLVMLKHYEVFIRPMPPYAFQRVVQRVWRGFGCLYFTKKSPAQSLGQPDRMPVHLLGKMKPRPIIVFKEMNNYGHMGDQETRG